MNESLQKWINLARCPKRADRIVSWAEIMWNRFVNLPAPSEREGLLDFDDFRKQTTSQFGDLLAPGGAAELAVREAAQHFRASIPAKLPYSVLFNADPAFAAVTYALTRCYQPEVVVENGVGFGLCSGLILRALEENGKGRLHSLDLPPILDVQGEFTGIAVPRPLWQRWDLRKVTGSRSALPHLLREVGPVHLFLADGANVHTAKQFEYRQAWPYVCQGGWMLLNEASGRFAAERNREADKVAYHFRMVEKHGRTATALRKR